MPSVLASKLRLSVCEVRWQNETERDERDGDKWFRGIPSHAVAWVFESGAFER